MSEVMVSAISRLPEDILLHTFYFIIQIPQSSRRSSSELTDLRRATQVSASWRRFLLASSSLWGMAIYLEQLEQRTCHWREEVLRRSGNSLLDVRGFVRTRVMDVLERFLASILNDHWPRIRTLNLRIDRGHQIMRPVMSSAFQKPAPCLEFFAVESDVDPFDFSPPTFLLFADHAPRMQEFICQRHLRPRPRQLWLSNLRVLKFSCRWTARALLGTLANMPLLEALVVVEKEGGDWEDIGLNTNERTNLPQITLPRLKDLSFLQVTGLQNYIAVLEHLVPPPGLDFGISTNIPLGRADLIAIQQIFRSYLHISFKGKYPNYLKIIHGGHSIAIVLSRDSYTFRFHLSFVDREEIQDMAMFLETVRSISFEYITKCSFDIYGGASELTKTVLCSILSSIASVEELYVTPLSLRVFLSLPMPTGYILFPLLKTLQIDSRCNVPFLLNFLASRHALGLPIQILDFYGELPLYEPFGNLHDCLHALEQFVVMKVTWLPDGEYICGSGNPNLHVDDS